MRNPFRGHPIMAAGAAAFGIVCLAVVAYFTSVLLLPILVGRAAMGDANLNRVGHIVIGVLIWTAPVLAAFIAYEASDE